MSTEEYLTGEKREKVKIYVKKALATRMTNKEILQELNSNDVDISERTLRRIKNEVHHEYGDSISDVYHNVVSKTYGDDLYACEILLRECWKLYSASNVVSERLRIIKQISQIERDKHAGIGQFSVKHRIDQIKYEDEEPCRGGDSAASSA
jgi:hypothetical protein